MEDNKNKYESSEYIVAFIDVLGASDAMEKDHDKLLNDVHKVYEDALELYRNIYQGHEDIGIRVFSDNIVIFHKCNDSTYSASLGIVVTFAAAIQLKFLDKEVLVRGGITKGNFFCDDLMIWGDALAKAYSIEGHVAIYPRIVIDKELIDISNSGKPIIDLANSLTKDFITQDSDGLFFVDYLKLFNRLRKISQKHYNCKCKEYIEYVHQKMLEFEKNYKKIRILQKYNWHFYYLSKNMYDFDRQKYVFDEDSK